MYEADALNEPILAIRGCAPAPLRKRFFDLGAVRFGFRVKVIPLPCAGLVIPEGDIELGLQASKAPAKLSLALMEAGEVLGESGLLKPFKRRPVCVGRETV